MHLRQTRKLPGAGLRIEMVILAGSLAFLAPMASARDTIGGRTAGPGAVSAGNNAAASQTATAATAATAQALQAAITARRAQDSFIHAAAALQAVQSAQAAARSAAINGANHLVGTTDVPDGLTIGGLNPVGGVPSPLSGSAIQLIQLNSGGKNQLALGGSGSVTLPNGTPGADKITVSGAGSVTSPGGSVTTTAGSVTTTTGGTLATTAGGTISLTAGSGTLTATTATTFSSTLAGTVTLPANGGTVAFTANQSVPLPAGSTVAFTGSGAGTVNISGAGTVALKGAGTLALGTTTASNGGTITTTSGTSSFTNGGQVSALPPGSQINLIGSGTIALSGTTDGSAAAALSLIVPSGSLGPSSFNFTTTGTVLSTQSFNLPATWSGVGALSESKGNGSTVTDTITQSSAEALLYWTSFNIGKNTVLNFDQSAGGANAGSWVAINQIVNDPSLAPSQILGSIQAPGQVYVINQNGIIFGGSSQVNTHALVASSLPINTNLLSPEFLLGGSSTENQFLFSQLTVNQIPGVSNALPSFTPLPAPAGGDGAVIVQPGAILQAPSTGANVGGRIALLGPTVDNEGTISTPDGQTILAAGLQVGFNAHLQTDPSLRGLDVFVGGVTDGNGNTFGTVTNDGLIESPRADVTMAGRDVEQNGIIDSLTSVALNGRVDLLADYNVGLSVTSSGGVNETVFTNISTGTVNLGPNSIMQILPDTSSATVVGTSLALSSLINVEALNINMASGAQLLAPGAMATTPTFAPSVNGAPAQQLTSGSVDLAGAGLTAGVNFDTGQWTVGGIPSLTPSSGLVTINSGATIDVSGSQNVAASVSEDIISVQLRGSELANSPLQQDGPLRGQTVDVDIRQSGVYNGVAWIGSPIGDLSGYAGLVQHTAQELTANGGTVNIQAGTNVNIAANATINVSGGSINYQAADIATTKVITATGHLVDISQATPDQLYQGLYAPFTVSSPKWGVTQTFGASVVTTTTHDPGYLQGGNGGALTISSPSATLNGNLYANTVAGINQVSPTKLTSSLNATFLHPSNNAQELGLSQFANATFLGSDFLPILVPMKAVPASGSLILNLFPAASGQNVQPQDVVFQPSTGPRAVDPFASSGNPELDLSADLVNLDGFGHLAIEGNALSPSPGAAHFNAVDNIENTVVPASMGGNIAVPAGVALNLQPGGALTLASVNLDIESSIAVPGGSMLLNAQNVLSSQVANATTPIQAVANRGDFTLGNDALLSTAGLVVDNAAGAPGANTVPQFNDGGTITIKGYNADLEAGTSIDVSGGVVVARSGKATYGAGGKIDIEAGQDPFFDKANNFAIVGGQLTLGSTLSGYSGSKGGSLSILAPSIQVGGSTLENLDPSASPVVQEGKLVWGNGSTLWLDRAGTADFLSQGGFGSFSLTGLGLAPITYANGEAQTINPFASTPGVVLASNLNLAPVAQSYQAITTASGVDLVTTTYSLASQRTPVSLAFSTPGVSGFGSLVVRGDLVMDPSASIVTDPLASVSLTGQTVTVLGKVTAPGGSITVTGAADSTNLFVNSADAVTVDLGPSSVLSTAGTFEATYNALGYTTGNVLNGGTITIHGNIIGEAGSVLNVSGTSSTVDVTPAAAGLTATGGNPQQLVPWQESSNGGSIVIGAAVSNGALAGEIVLVDSTMIGRAGPGAEGGTLTVSNGFSDPANANLTGLDATLIVTAGGTTHAATALTGKALIGQAIAPVVTASDVDGDAILGVFAANTNLFLTQGASAARDNNGGVAGGFTSLVINGTPQFSGPVTIGTAQHPLTSLLVAGNPASTTTFTGVNGGFIFADSTVNLSSDYVRLGLAFVGPGGKPTMAQPNGGAGMLSVNASQLIDVGNLSLENIGQLNLTTAGDVRGDGTLNITGNVAIDAAQVYPVTESSFTIDAFSPLGGNSLVTFANSSGNLAPLPLSAGGNLTVYADAIEQGGVLRAPLGTIDLGSVAPPDGFNLPTTGTVTLAAGSTTSVSAVDPVTGVGLTIPYGSIDNSGNWNDPAGNPLTAGSTPTLPAKSINLSAGTVNVASDAGTSGSGSTLDISGGGNLFAAQFVAGTGGSSDILASTGSFAILPSGNQLSYAPFDTGSGYATNAYSNFHVGDQIYLSASNGLAAGVYTLLPARYALVPGAYLVTPKSGVPLASGVAQLDGSSLVSGYRLSSLDSTREQTASTLFEVASQGVVAGRADYLTSNANTFFPQSAASLSHAVPRLPIDAGQLVLNATDTLTLASEMRTLASQATGGGLGSIVDIATTADINIGSTTVAGDLNLDPAGLTGLNAGSLLIGGFRNAAGTTATVTTNSLTVDNAGGTALSANDLILVSNGALQVMQGSTIEASTGTVAAQPLAIINGSSGTASSDGALLRVSSSLTAPTTRPDAVDLTDAVPQLTIGAGVTITGASVTLDSTGSADSIDPSATLTATGTASISSGQISLDLDNNPAATGLVLSGTALTNLQSSAQALSLLSYSSIDIYGTGSIGASAVDGKFQVQSLALHAAEIRGFDNGGQQVTINAQNVLLDNSAGEVSPGAAQAPAAGSTLAINAGTITLGVNPLAIDQYAQVNLTAANAIVLSNGTGSLSTAGGLTLATPLLTAAPVNPLTPSQEVTGQATPATATTQTISAAGALKITGTGGAVPTLGEGLGAHVTLAGTSIESDSNIQLPSGTLALVATTGDLTVKGTLDVSGTQKAIYNATEYSSGGQVSLTSYRGGVILDSGSTVNVSAPTGGGNAGSVAISAPQGTFTFAGSSILGQGGAGGQGGSFSLDVGGLGGTSLTPLEQALNPVVTGAVAGDRYLGGFTQAQTIRVRAGDVTLDGLTATDAFNLSTDAGSITVSGLVAGNSSGSSIDVTTVNSGGTTVLANPGVTGGSISLEANGSVTLLSGSLLSVAAQSVDDAGKGGLVTLEAGAETDGNEISTSQGRDGGTHRFSGVPVIDIQTGSVIDLSVAATDKTFDGSLINGATGTLHLRAAQTANNTDVQIDPILGKVVNPSSMVVEGYQVFDAASDGSIDNVETAVMTNGQTFAGIAGQPATSAYTAMLNALISSASLQNITSIEPGAEIINNNLDTAANPAAGDLTLASDWDLSTYRFGQNNVAGDLTLRAGGNIILNFGASLSDGFTTNPIASLAADGLWSDVLMSSGSQSWSYRIVSGADFGAADFHQVLPALQSNALVASSPVALAANSGSVLVGVGTPADTISGLTTAQIMSAVSIGGLGYFQTIRTGTGTIDIASGGDVQLLNNVATIYTAGTQVGQTVETGTVSVESNPNDPNFPGPGNTVVIAPATLPDAFQVGSTFLGSTIVSINGNVITLAGNANTTVSAITPEAFSGTGSGVVDVSSSSTSSTTVTLTTQPPGLTPGASLLGSTILSISGSTVTLAGVVQAPDTFTNESFTFSTPQAGFDVPVLTNSRVGSGTSSNSNYNFALNTNTQAQYSQNGGNVTISAQGNIAHYSNATGTLTDDSSEELPTNWLLRRGFEVNGVFANNAGRAPEVASTTWWVDFNNFFEGVGTLGGGNLTLTAGQSVNNVDAVVPTNATMAGKDANGNLIAPSASNLVENGGGDLIVRAGDNINGGVYYVERGQGTLEAGGQVMTNPTRTVVLNSGTAPEASPYLPTTLYLGKGSYNVAAGGDLLLGPVVNPFLLPQGINNTNLDKSYFSTYASTDSVTATSLSGQVTIKEGSAADSLLIDFYNDQVSLGTRPTDFTRLQPWLGLIEATPSAFATQADLLPGTISVVSLSGDINLQGNLTLSPSPTGNVSLVATGSVNAFQPVALATGGVIEWGSSQIDLSDADPSRINGITSPLSYTGSATALAVTNSTLFTPLVGLFNVSGSLTGTNALLSTEQQVHADIGNAPLHAGDTTPVQVYAATGDIDGLNLFSGKFVDAVAGTDLMNVALYVQNVSPTDITLVQAGRDIIAYDENSTLRQETHATGGIYLGENHDSGATDFAPNGTQQGGPDTGDIQLGGPGTLEVLAGRNLTLGGLEDNANKIDGTGFGILSIGNTLNPALPFAGANVVAAAGLGGSGSTNANAGLSAFGLDASHNSLANFAAFETLFLNPVSGGLEAPRYLPVLGSLLGLTDVSDVQIWNAFAALPVERQDALASTIFYDVLRDAGRDQLTPDSFPGGGYNEGYAAITALFPKSGKSTDNLGSIAKSKGASPLFPDATVTSYAYSGDISLTAREIKTTNVGSISLLAPGGGIDVGLNNNGAQALDQGVLTVSGGNIAVFARDTVSLGTSRIFTLHGGNIIGWSSLGSINAGASSKTVQSAPPTRVLIDPTSGNVQTDLAGLATGGGIGVLETVVGAPPGDVDLVAPNGTIDAGDAGIRASGNVHVIGQFIANAGNIQSGGSTSGVAAAPTPNIGATVAASSAAGSSQSAAGAAARQSQPNQSAEQNLPSIISVEVIGYSAGDSDSADTATPTTDQYMARNNGR